MGLYAHLMWIQANPSARISAEYIWPHFLHHWNPQTFTERMFLDRTRLFTELTDLFL